MPTASWGHPCRCCLCPAPPGNCRGAPKGAAGTVTRAAWSPAGLAGTSRQQRRRQGRPSLTVCGITSVPASLCRSSLSRRGGPKRLASPRRSLPGRQLRDISREPARSAGNWHALGPDTCCQRGKSQGSGDDLSHAWRKAWVRDHRHREPGYDKSATATWRSGPAPSPPERSRHQAGGR
jgi:hypothetical protein